MDLTVFAVIVVVVFAAYSIVRADRRADRAEANLRELLLDRLLDREPLTDVIGAINDVVYTLAGSPAVDAPPDTAVVGFDAREATRRADVDALDPSDWLDGAPYTRPDVALLSDDPDSPFGVPGLKPITPLLSTLRDAYRVDV